MAPSSAFADPGRQVDPRAVDAASYRGRMPTDPRPAHVIADELATVERYLADAPPHSGAGHRDDLMRRAQALRRELAEARRRRERTESG